MMKKILLYLFLAVSAGEIASTLIDLPAVHLVCKPALMLMLGLYYWFTKKHKQEPASGVVLLAILFSGAGDVLLMFQSQASIYFMLGLGSFLVAHVCYIFAYRQHCNEDVSRALQGIQKFRYSFPILFAGVGLVSILYNHLGDLKIPVMVYAGVLSYMVLNALFRFGRTSAISFAMVFGGAILFMMSDTLLAINKFLEPIQHEGFWIMTTYISGQFLIVRGLLKHE